MEKHKNLQWVLNPIEEKDIENEKNDLNVSNVSEEEIEINKDFELKRRESLKNEFTLVKEMLYYLIVNVLEKRKKKTMKI